MPGNTEVSSSASLDVNKRANSCEVGLFPFSENNQMKCSDIPHLIAMVGLPARGKTYMSRKLAKYLNWIGISCKVFNLGEYRREVTQQEFKSSDFFSSNNIKAQEFRDQLAAAVLDDACTWLQEHGSIAIFDATNSTRERRQLLYNEVVKKRGFKLFFVESICDDAEIIDATIKEIKINSPDYVGKNTDEAVEDFQKRIQHYEKRYEILDENAEKHLSFMKIYNAGEKIVIYHHEGHIESRVVYYLMNTHIIPRNIYLTRHGESLLNYKGCIGGDTGLSEKGALYARMLGDYVNNQNIPSLKVWTSWMKRTTQTAQYINAPMERWKLLNEIHAGICEEMTYEEFQSQYPKEFAYRDHDKFHYRYPCGESYQDLVTRLEPVIMELERQKNILVISHQAVIRCLLAYFLDKNTDELPYIRVPLHTLIKLNLSAYSCDIEFIPMNINVVDGSRDNCKDHNAMDHGSDLQVATDDIVNVKDIIEEINYEFKLEYT